MAKTLNEAIIEAMQELDIIDTARFGETVYRHVKPWVYAEVASLAAAYERGKRDAAEHQPIYNYNGDPESCIAPHCNWDRRNDQPRSEWLQHILALKDRGAKGDGE